MDLLAKLKAKAESDGEKLSESTTISYPYKSKGVRKRRVVLKFKRMLTQEEQELFLSAKVKIKNA